MATRGVNSASTDTPPLWARLEQLRGLAALRTLFCADLGYRAIGQPLSRRGWCEHARSAPAEDPLLLAAAGEDGRFHIVYARLASPRLPLDAERLIVQRLLPDHPYALFVFTDAEQGRWHFVNVAYHAQPERRRVFRRLTVGPEERLRTAAERLARLDVTGVADELAPLALQRRHDEAFEVEPLLTEFRRGYREAFEAFEGRVEGLPDAAQRRLYTQRRFNRLMVMAFMAKKGGPRFEDGADDLAALFGRFNFTLTESTPLDVEVAVDPEMLGTVFEELVTGRHASGSYYTPKPVVSFMCREALKCHLATCLGEPSREAVATFVDGHDPAALHHPEAVLEALRTVRTCDPACGSGAFVIGMMHELLDLRACLFAAAPLDTPSLFERKLAIIEQNLYGVDLDALAVDIARLRLWLSLAVESEEVPPPLDTNLDVGDSLMTPFPSPSGGFDIVVTNPPYLSTKHGFAREHRRALQRLYVTAKGQFDAYNLFVERGLQLLAPDGAFAFIIPKPVLTNSNMRPVRELLGACALTALADPGQVFTASVEPIVIAGCKSAAGEREVMLCGDGWVKHATFEAIRSPAGTWTFAPASTRLGTSAELAGLPTFGSLFTVTRGIECGKRDGCIHDEEGPARFPLLRGEDVEPFRVRFAGLWVERDDRVARFKPPSLYQGPSLLIRRVATDLIAAVDRRGHHVLNTLYVAKPRPDCAVGLDFLAGILNSSALNEYFHAVFLNDDEVFPYVRAEQLASLPIPIPTPEEEEAVSEAVRIIEGALESGAAEEAETHRRHLDALVVRVYRRCAAS